MPAPSSFDYAVVRVVPRVERGEFVNAGVDPLLRTRRASSTRASSSTRRACCALDAGRRPGGRARPPGGDSAASAPAARRRARSAGCRSASASTGWSRRAARCIQTSPVHTGLCDDPPRRSITCSHAWCCRRRLQRPRHERSLPRPPCGRRGPAVPAAHRPDPRACEGGTPPSRARRLDRCARLRRARRADGPRRGQPRSATAFARATSIAICAATSIEYAVTFLGALRAGVAVAPLAPSSTPESLAAMLTDCGARLLFVDREVSTQIESVVDRRSPPRGCCSTATSRPARRSRAGSPPAGSAPQPVEIEPESAVQHHLLVGHDRHAQGHRAAAPHALGARAGAAAIAATARDGHDAARPRSTRTRRSSASSRRSRSAAPSC